MLTRKAPLKRGKGLRRRNNARARKADARNFGEEAKAVRAMPCLVAGRAWTLCGRKPDRDRIEAAHVIARGMGGAKGGRFDIVPLCPCHHDAASEAGTDRRATFEKLMKIDLRAEADRIALEHPEPLGIRGLARRWAAWEAGGSALGMTTCYRLDDHERSALLGWVRRRMGRIDRRSDATDHGNRWDMADAIATDLDLPIGHCECGPAKIDEMFESDGWGCCYYCGEDPLHDDNGEPKGAAWKLCELAGWPS